MQSECKNIDLPTCGICATVLNFNLLLEKQVQEHPLLKILVCQNCFENFNMTDNDILCSWCKISEETIVKCINCFAVYCKKCLERNFEEDKLKVILRKKQWLCFACDPVLLSNRRDSCKKVLNWLSNNEFPYKDSSEQLSNCINMTNNDTDLNEIRQALINKSTQLSEMGFQLITRSISHMTVFKLQDTTLPNILEALNYQSQLMLSVSEMCKVFNAEIANMQKKLESSNEDVSQEPEVTSGTTNALSCHKKENKIRKRKHKNKLSLVSNTVNTAEVSNADKNNEKEDTEEESPSSNPEILVNGIENLNKSHCDSSSEKISLFSQETVQFNIQDKGELLQKSVGCAEEKIDNSNSEPTADGKVLLSEKNDVIIHEANKNSSTTTTSLSSNVTKPLLPNDADTSIIQEENLKRGVNGSDNHSTSEEHESTVLNNGSNNKLSDNQDNVEKSSTGLCSTKEIDDRYVEMFKQYDDFEVSESDEEDLNSLSSEKDSAYSTPDELRTVGHITTILPDLPSDDEQVDVNKHSENSKPNGNINDQSTLSTCAIVLNRIESTITRYKNGYNAEHSENSQSSNDKEEREIEGLSNLNAIGVKRKRLSQSSNEEVVKSDVKKSKVHEKDNDSDSDSTMSLSLSLDENNKTDLPVEENHLEIPMEDCIEPLSEEQEQTNLPTVESDFDSDLIKDSDEENVIKSKKKEKLNQDENKEKLNQDENKENEPLKEESEVKPRKSKRPKWRNDPLLRGKISEDSDSDGDKSVNSVEQVRRKRIKRVEQNENHVSDANPQSSNEDASDGEVSNFIKIFSSDSDSSIEFVKEFKNKNKRRSPINLNFSSDCESSSEEEVNVSINKGRKNIRSICSESELSILTKKAMDTEKLRRERVNNKQKLMAKVLNNSTENFVLDVDEVTHTPIITVHPVLYKRLKDHQRHGVQFMYNCCYENVNNEKKNEGTGCILAHSMGLGKTFQVVTLIHTLFAHEVTNTKHVLIVCPLSVVLNWRDEFREALESVNDNLTINVFYISDKCDITRRVELIKRWQKQTGTLIMGYEAYQKLTLPKEKRFSSQVSKHIINALVNPGPDLVVLDEGHLLKNGKIARTRALMAIKSKRRIILTGTPLQNNLKEYYYMVNFVKPNYLGSLKEYSNRFMNPISNGQYHDSTERDIKQMKKRSHILNKLLNVYVIQRYGISELEKYLPKRHDHVLFIELHSVQIKLYTKYIDNLESSVAEKNNIFNNFHFLQFICSHPIALLMKEKASIKANLKSNRPTTDSPDLQEVTGLPSDWWNSLCPDDFKNNLDYGPKYKVMMAIIKECEAVGDKVLIFSNSMIDLETIEYFLHQNSTSTSEWKRDLDYFRMDGSVSQAKRSEMCHSFNNPNNKRVRVFLLSYRVGCLGINLKAANRVILMNVSWNPAIDSQSIFRMYRFGQVKECFVYRLVAMGAMEEVLYERQITKLAIARRVIDETQVSRHYRSSDLQIMYRFNFQTNQPRPMLHVPKDAILKKIIETYPECVFKFHEHQSLLEDRPDEGLNADDMKSAWEEYYKEDEDKTEQQRKQIKNVPPVPGPSGITNLSNTKGYGLQFKNFVSTLSNTPNNSTSTPIKTVSMPPIVNNVPVVIIPQASNLRPNLNSTPFNNFRINANNIRTNHSHPKITTNATSSTKTTTSQINSSLTTINPFHLNKQVTNSRTINSHVINCDEVPLVLNTLARAIHNNNMKQTQTRAVQNTVSGKNSGKQIILSKKEEQNRLLTSMHSNSEITISTIGDPRPSTPNVNSNMDSVILID